MWGRRRVAITPYLTIKDFALLRSVAKVDIVVDDAQVPANVFKIKSVGFFNFSKNCAVMPEEYFVVNGKAMAVSGGCAPSDGNRRRIQLTTAVSSFTDNYLLSGNPRF